MECELSSDASNPQIWTARYLRPTRKTYTTVAMAQPGQFEIPWARVTIVVQIVADLPAHSGDSRVLLIKDEVDAI